VLSAIAATGYTLSHARHAEVLAELHRRRSLRSRSGEQDGALAAGPREA